MQMAISLVPKSVAKVGYQFTHLGGVEICAKCQFLPVCVDSLDVGSSYEIIELREKEHPCLLDKQPMLVCDVKEINDRISVKEQKYLDNVVVSRDPIKCVEILCDNYEYCVPLKYEFKSKVKILNIIEKVTCPLKYNLVMVEVKKISE